MQPRTQLCHTPWKVHNLLGSTREEPGLRGAREDAERWRQEGRTPGRDPSSKGTSVKMPEEFGGQGRLDHHQP